MDAFEGDENFGHNDFYADEPPAPSAGFSMSDVKAERPANDLVINKPAKANTLDGIAFAKPKPAPKPKLPGGPPQGGAGQQRERARPAARHVAYNPFQQVDASE